MGGRGGSGARLGITLTQSDWEDWAVDAQPYQAAIRGEDIPKYSSYDGHKYSKGELNRIREVATEIQRQALTSTVDTYTLFRGESYESLAEATKKYKIGATITNSSLTSYATDSDVATAYSEANIDIMGKKAVKVVITNVSQKGDSVGVVTNPLGVGGSSEVITPMGMKSKVTNTFYDKESNTLYVAMINNAVPSKNTNRKKKVRDK